ncbi:MAG: DMT family transporter [Patescibacteria group bacterium]|jgi:drug/metabolite transporter (DMT)-like permease
MPRRPKFYAYVSLLIATAIWAAAGPIIKLTLGYIPVITFLFLRFLIVCILISPFMWLEIKRNPINRKDIKNFVILGILSQTVLIVPFYGYQYTRAIDAALIGITYPVMAVAAGSYFFKEVVTKMEKAGMILATLGASVIMIEPILSGMGVSKVSGMSIFGNVLIFVYQLSWVAYIIWSKAAMGEKSIEVSKTSKKLRISPMTKKYSPSIITMFTFFVGLASFIPLVIAENISIKAALQY